MAEMFGPYDPASPCLTTVCKRISKEEYDKQASEATESAIAELIQYLEYNPTAYHNVLRKRKREEQENAGVLSWMKVKMLSTIFGVEYVEKIDEDEARAKISSLKKEMISAYDYSEDARGSGKRFSQRIAQKRLQNLQKQNKTPTRCNSQICSLLPQPPCPIAKNLEQDLLANTTDSLIDSIDSLLNPKPNFVPPKPPPPPPLPPLIYNDDKMKEGCVKEPPFQITERNIASASRKQSSKEQQERKTESPRKPITRNKSKASKENTCANQEPKSVKLKDVIEDTQNLLDAIKSPSARASLKPVNIGLAYESPYQFRKKINALKGAETAIPLFNQQLISKFQNARSPQSPQYLSDISPSGSFNISQ
eukprot:gene14196-15677_t